jgi:hypothetical protein
VPIRGFLDVFSLAYREHPTGCLLVEALDEQAAKITRDFIHRRRL